MGNLVVAHLSAERTLRALRQGIRVDNIIRFLESAAHPRALRRREEGAAIVPENVSSQLEVWESNRNRTRSQRAVLFEWDRDELDAEAFDRMKQLAGSNLLWACDAADMGCTGRDGGLQSFVLAVTSAGAACISAQIAQPSNVRPSTGLLSGPQRNQLRRRL